MSKTIFKKIIDKEIPATIVYESETVLAFKDANPVAPVHILVIPKKEIESVDSLSSNDFKDSDDGEILLDMFKAIKKIVAEQGIAKTGYRLVVNNGKDAQQSVNHLHIHVIGGKFLKWPPC
ncbi:MAG: histidine triad nucleotide-binding protein [Bdellovibrionota bacterium]